MEKKESVNKLEIYAAEGVARLQASDIVESSNSNLYISKERHEALKFTRYEDFFHNAIVEIKLAHSDKDIVELIDEIAHELHEDGIELDIERFKGAY